MLVHATYRIRRTAGRPVIRTQYRLSGWFLLGVVPLVVWLERIPAE